MALLYLSARDRKVQRAIDQHMGRQPPLPPKEFAQILPIFLPFSKMDAVESAASEENG
jgi:hypothetical protein